ncbi:T-cell surface glycoprotein CD8 alpha chain [Trachinotus anak]|uniref:T-cell surface glycoprotein CD8 alpha chain n=1 Tax=Trachinotus anak TaxID=443729 RepID=UPI0039F1C65E
MHQKWIQLLVMLVFYPQTASEVTDKQVKEAEKVEIGCEVSKMFSTLMWFRVLDTSGMQFIASFDKDGKLKNTLTLPAEFDSTRMGDRVLTLKSFSRARDSGLYSCAVIRGSALEFGGGTRLRGVEVATKPTQAITVKPNLPTTTACVCNSKYKPGEVRLPVPCSPIILGPLAGGCGLLLLLLIITALYCNRVRTRRCPHHHKRKPRMMPPEKHMANRHV